MDFLTTLAAGFGVLVIAVSGVTVFGLLVALLTGDEPPGSKRLEINYYDEEERK